MRHIRIDVGPFKNFYYLDNYCQLKKEIEKTYNLKPEQYYIISSGRIIKENYDFNEGLSSNYQLHLKIKGGLGGIDFSVITDPLSSITDGLNAIKDFFLAIPRFFKWIFVDLFRWVFLDFINPIYILADISRGIISVLRVIILAILDFLSGILRKLVNMLFEPIVSNFWGYSPSESEIDPKDKSETVKCAKGKKCFQQPDTYIAFPVIISTVVLPPMGLFMELGLKGWMNIMLCAILTLFYYFPGLIYALIILYC